jgi:hypothetical protein
MITSNITQGTSTSNFIISGTTTFTADFSGSTAPSVHQEVTNSTTERIMIFKTVSTNHTFAVPTGGLNCDILMIGGGGGGGASYGNAAGAGACIVAINQTLPAGSCIVNVGAGGTGKINGNDSYILIEGNYRYRAFGGGGTINDYSTKGYDGGCGGGAGYGGGGARGEALTSNVVNGVIENTLPRITTTYAVLGNPGCYGTNGNGWSPGGGIGSAGAPNVAGDGRYSVTINGTEYIFRTHFANGGNSFGVLNSGDGQYYIGGGGNYSSLPGGLGGGGGANGTAPFANTGSGGGNTTNGASGIIIIRYRTATSTTTTTYTHTPTLTTTLSTPTLLGNSAIELVRGTQGDSNTDYKLGNYGGDFKVISSSLSTDTDRLNITSAGNVGIGTTSPQVKLHVTGEVYATGNITAYFSDERLKTKISSIHNPLEIIRKLNGFYYIPNDLAHFNGITNTDKEVGLSAQEVQRVLPEVVKIAPFDSIRNAEGVIVSKSGENYLTMSYERLTPVFVEAIKELEQRNIELSQEITLINETLRSL